MITIKTEDGKHVGTFGREQLVDAFKAVNVISNYMCAKGVPSDWEDFVVDLIHSDLFKLSFSEFNDVAYAALVRDRVFEAISGGRWIPEDVWEYYENTKNYSSCIYELGHNCDECDIFSNYGLDNICDQAQALELFKMIDKEGF